MWGLLNNKQKQSKMKKELNNNEAKLPVSGCCWVVKFENGDSPFWLADWEGDPGRTLKIENAKRFVNFISADKARLEAEKNNPHRKLKGYPHSVDCNSH